MSAPLRGAVRLPGDKSISHRALILGSLCEGPVEIRGIGQGRDNMATAQVLSQLGVQIDRSGLDLCVHGVGLRGLEPPDSALDCGNSGTTMRLMLGVLTGQPFEATLIGDESLSRRPMARVLDPLGSMGLELLESADDRRAPLKVRGTRDVRSSDYQSPLASAQVKSAILLAGLWAPTPPTVIEPYESRDHTERMLRYLTPALLPKRLDIPGDLSSAAFIAAAALLNPGSEVVLRDVGINPTRTGFIDVLLAMGAKVEIGDQAVISGEPRANIRVSSSCLRGVRVSGQLTVRTIDELPLIATLASIAEGATVIEDAAELRVKESDRISATVSMLRSFGVEVHERPDGFVVLGDPRRDWRAGRVDASGDHRIAMCAKLLERLAPPGTVIDGQQSIGSSFPEFETILANLETR